MQRQYHRWHSQRLGREMGVAIFGHWGSPFIVFPTSGGDEWEFDRMGVIDALGEIIDGGRAKLYCVNVNHSDSFANHGAHPLHRSWMQRQYDEYVLHEVIPLIRADCQTWDIQVGTIGASLGAYHAANTLFKHPDTVKRCYALSGVYDMKRFMDDLYDDAFYFNNPVDYLANLSDPWTLGQLASCEIHLATGTGPWEQSGETYRLCGILSSRGIPHHCDDWGSLGGHDWPFWTHQLREYLR